MTRADITPDEVNYDWVLSQYKHRFLDSLTRAKVDHPTDWTGEQIILASSFESRFNMLQRA